MRYPEGFLARGDADVALVSTPQSRVVRGEVRLNRLFYLEDVQPRHARPRPRAPAAAAPAGGETDPFLASTQLNVQITGPEALRVNNNIAKLRGDVDLTCRGRWPSRSSSARSELEPGGTLVYSDNNYELERGLITFNNPYPHRSGDRLRGAHPGAQLRHLALPLRHPRPPERQVLLRRRAGRPRGAGAARHRPGAARAGTAAGAGRADRPDRRRTSGRPPSSAGQAASAGQRARRLALRLRPLPHRSAGEHRRLHRRRPADGGQEDLEEPPRHLQQQSGGFGGVHRARRVAGGGQLVLSSRATARRTTTPWTPNGRSAFEAGLPVFLLLPSRGSGCGPDRLRRPPLDLRDRDPLATPTSATVSTSSRGCSPSRPASRSPPRPPPAPCATCRRAASPPRSSCTAARTRPEKARASWSSWCCGRSCG